MFVFTTTLKRREAELDDREEYLNDLERDLKLERKLLDLEKENFERNQEVICKEYELQFQYRKNELEDEWHCKLGQHIEDEKKEASKEIFKMIEKVLEHLPKQINVDCGKVKKN